MTDAEDLAGPIAYHIGEFEFVQGVMVLPAHGLWYRAYDPAHPPLPHEPLFFGDVQVAYMYAKQHTGRRLGEFRAKRPLRLLDIRYVTAIMPYLYRFMTAHPSLIAKMSLALGTCSFAQQVRLLHALHEKDHDAFPDLPHNIRRMEEFSALPDAEKPAWANPIELQGVRVGITPNDYEMCRFWKALFPVDGILAPKLPTPFHDHDHPDVRQSVMYQELMLFDPAEALEFVQDRPIGPRMDFYGVLTVPLQQAHVDVHHPTSLARLRPPRIRLGGSSSAPTLPIRDAMGEEVSWNVRAKKEWGQRMKPWYAAAKAIRKAVPSLAMPTICVPILMPPP